MHPINCALDDNLVSDSNNITMTANTALFILGGLVFLVAFSWFKAAALKLYSTSINKDAYDNDLKGLVAKFQENFKKFNLGSNIISAGPGF